MLVNLCAGEGNRTPMIETPLHVWIVFNVVVALLLGVDMFFFHRRPHAVRMREALAWSAFWICLALLFNLSIYLAPGVYGLPKEEAGQWALKFLTAYLVEESLSMDNLFVFLLIFSFFKVPPELRHKTLFWGIIGAMVMRALFILMGTALIQRFDWIIYVFGALLIYSGIKMALSHGADIDPEHNSLLKLVRRFIPITRDYEGDKFFVRRAGKLWGTPLFITLVMIEASDLMFAIDSIPAVLAIIPNHPFFAYSSNICAILGLRSLFFALAGLMGLFRFLHYGLVAILIFIGAKMLLHAWIHIPTGLSLGIVGSLLAASIIASLLIPEKVVPQNPELEEAVREVREEQEMEEKAEDSRQK